jgi:hypothetical protein
VQGHAACLLFGEVALLIFLLKHHLVEPALEYLCVRARVRA